MELSLASSMQYSLKNTTPEEPPKLKFLDAWDQKREGLELIKGQIMDENHVTFA
jgi:hypothetical protein